MLRHLTIRDFVIVDRLELEFSTGFGALTGETGAGKSILLDAISLVLGERGDAGVVREGTQRAEVAAEFSLDGLVELADWLEESDLAGEEGVLLLRRVIDEIPDPVLIKDQQGNYLLGNRAVARLYDTTPDQLVGRDDGYFGVPAEIAEGFRQSVQAIMASGQTTVVIENSRDANTGEIRQFRSTKAPFRDADGRMQILVIAHDITDITQAQAELEQHRPHLQELVTARTAELAEAGRATLTLRQQAWRNSPGQEPQLLAEGTIRIGWVDSRTLKPGRIPATILKALQP